MPDDNLDLYNHFFSEKIVFEFLDLVTFSQITAHMSGVVSICIRAVQWGGGGEGGGEGRGGGGWEWGVCRCWKGDPCIP